MIITCITCKKIDKRAGLCYNIVTSPLFLRGQGARRLTAASAFLIAGGTQ
jgi:hypothetical protein